MVFSALIGRLYYLQFVKTGEYQTLAEDNRVKLQLIPPPRGSLLDKDGRKLAINQKNFRMLVEFNSLEELEHTLRGAASHIGINGKLIESALKEARTRRFSPPVLIKEHLNWEEVAKLEFHTPELPGLVIDTGQMRHYPLGEKASHLIGHIGAVSQDELDGQPLLRLPDFKIGKAGVEKMLEQELRGKAGVKHVEVNVHGLPVRELSSAPSESGSDIRLTIDARLQEFAANRLQGQSGAAVVMDVHSGGLLALVSIPGFDPNRFSVGITTDYWKELNADKKNPLLNKAIAGQYPPGSVFKMLVGLAGLEAGIIAAGSGVFCPGHFFLGSHQFNCWKPEGHGYMTIRSAIAHSCDTFFYTIAQRLGIDPIARMARLLGLGEVTSLGLPGEKPGLIPDKAWKLKRYKQPWQGGDTINVGIGQGYVLATPLQLAVMTARLASGYAVAPRIILQKTDYEAFERLKIKPEKLRLIQEGMTDVVNSPGGTAYGRRITNENYAMAGKTGTSQVRKILIRGQRQEDLPWEYRHHALFVGYAPLHEPRYATAVLVEHGGGGASAAAPVAHDILLQAQLLKAADEKNPPRHSEIIGERLNDTAQ